MSNELVRGVSRPSLLNKLAQRAQKNGLSRSSSSTFVKRSNISSMLSLKRSNFPQMLGNFNNLYPSYIFSNFFRSKTLARTKKEIETNFSNRV